MPPSPRRPINKVPSAAEVRLSGNACTPGSAIDRVSAIAVSDVADERTATALARYPIRRLNLSLLAIRLAVSSGASRGERSPATVLYLDLNLEKTFVVVRTMSPAARRRSAFEPRSPVAGSVYWRSNSASARFKRARTSGGGDVLRRLRRERGAGRTLRHHRRSLSETTVKLDRIGHRPRSTDSLRSPPKGHREASGSREPCRASMGTQREQHRTENSTTAAIEPEHR